MTLSTRTLMAMFAIANVSLIWLLAFSALQGVDAIDAEVQHSTSATSALHLSMDADMMHEGIQAQVYRAVLHGREGRQADLADLADARQSLAQAVTRLERDLAGVRQLGLSDEVQRRAAEAEPVARAYSEEARALVQLAGADAVQAQARLVSFEQRFEALERSLDELGDLIGAQAEGARQRGDEAVSSVRQRVLLMSGALTLVLISGLSLFGRFLWRTLGGEPMEAVKIAQAIAEGDLSAAPSTSPSLRHSVLGEMAQMSQQLRQLVDEVRSQAEEVSSASSQIAQGNLDLSERTEAQASSLQQTSASMQDLGGTLHQTTTDARQATQVAHHACDVAHRGGEVMAGVVQTMQGIRESASRIADIISVIDGIAFQTNILALNAAVEAARAGEEGKGFAVVASEVRSLAQRTSQAAREIKTLIGDSVTRVAVGAEQVESARSTMHDIVECIGQVSGLVEQITQASELQSSGLVDATQAVHTMDCATQQNATLVEETAAAAESLRSQAQRLVQVVSRFRLTPA